MKKKFLTALLAGAMSFQASAQLQNNQSKFDLLSDFRATPTRSANGSPGASYWQNRADYVLNTELEPEKHALKGTFKITYTNNSPEDLQYVWLQLDQNKFKSDARGTYVQAASGGSRNRANATTGYSFENLKAGGKEAKYIITDTRMQIRLDAPLKGKGGKIDIEGTYSFDIPEYGSDRMGRIKMEKGWIYNMAQWYPRMCVYDDIKGWNVEPYLGSGEFYLEYGNIDYKVTAPNTLVVLGSGALQNPVECYTAEQLKRWDKARASDQTVDIISLDEVGTPQSRPTKPKITWHFKIENTRDAAFGASSAFIVDAARINLPSGKKILAISGYSKESVEKNVAGGGWERSTEYSKASIEHYSKMWYEFPYPAATNISGNIGGMEYPGLNFCGYRSKGEDLWGVTDHEFGHNWFPMIVGTNERLYPWMDEGFNTFINLYSTKEFNKGEYFDPKGFAISNVRNPQLQAFVVKSANREAISTYPDVAQDGNLGVTAYYKPAVGMVILREYILGADRFDYAFKSYIKTWAFKHPQPFDFFNHMNNAAGDELTWFWKAWFYGNGTIDQAVENVSYVEGKPENGALVVLKNNGDVMPVVVEITEENGKKITLNLPVEIWQKTNRKTIRVATTSKISTVQLDPKKQLPDVNAENDLWNADKKLQEEAQKKAEEQTKKLEEEKKKADEEAKKLEEEAGKDTKKKKRRKDK